ncbi:metallophosphatase domain-containing protein [Mangrovimonas sp. AS39]|uniref:metallophosphoesterase family protein n=1 Tax=Mangrovimonas futianensis TaxID=2895523 RepID=UPI001E5A5087|nr:metallophosphatase domain-containing protein [Mangrovimonas futianensis]
MIIDAISDLHGYYPKLEGGDLLIVAGDLTATDTLQEYRQFFLWLIDQNYRRKVLIAGNHDNNIESFYSFFSMELPPMGNINYLCDSGTEFEGLKIWGTPWTAQFPGINPKCCAFTVNYGCDTDDWLNEYWQKIPSDTDILITHGPSFGNLDYTTRGESVGSRSLWMKLLEIRPKLHIFGHIHEAYGQIIHHNGIHLINCSHVNERYQPVNKPIRIEL